MPRRYDAPLVQHQDAVRDEAHLLRRVSDVHQRQRQAIANRQQRLENPSAARQVHGRQRDGR